MPEDHFCENVAERYHDSESEMFDPAVRRGVRVYGIDLSEAMLGRLRAKPGAEQIGVTVGDFATATVDRTFSLAYLVFNTIENLTSQDEQVACFRNVATHLEPGGCFVIEVGVPDLRRLPYGERFVLFDVSATHVGIDEYGVAKQGLVSHHFYAVEGRFERSSVPFRYVWPSELDLMARLAGLTLRERWSGCTRVAPLRLWCLARPQAVPGTASRPRESVSTKTQKPKSGVRHRLRRSQTPNRKTDLPPSAPCRTLSGRPPPLRGGGGWALEPVGQSPAGFFSWTDERRWF
jgi:SAM-dependent methyltransferase